MKTYKYSLNKYFICLLFPYMYVYVYIYNCSTFKTEEANNMSTKWR